MPGFVHIAFKEFLLVRRDRNALALLFVMPTAFILIMSLALQSGFEAQKSVRIDYYLADLARSAGSAELTRLLDAPGVFRRLPDTPDIDTMRERVSQDQAKFLLVIDPAFETLLDNLETAVHIDVAPGAEIALAMLFESSVREALGKLYVDRELRPLREDGLDISAEDLESLLAVDYLFEGGRGQRVPSSVQQNVPAWLLFSMFFVSVPLSMTRIAERENGTLARLETMRLPAWQQIIGKLVPYVAINLCQVVLMLLVGIYVVPLFGGERLLLGDSMTGLAIISLAASFAAVSFGLFVAHLVRSNEQATILTGVMNVIMAAIGGVMVPRFLMPQVMQDFGWISPMTWGLEGFLDLFLRGGAVADVLPESAGLMAFSVAMLSLALLMSTKRSGA